MSTTADVELANVRRKFVDPDTGKPVIGDDAIREALDRSLLEVVDGCSLQPTWATPAFTTVAGTDTYTLSAGEYEFIDLLRFSSDKLVIDRKVTREQMARLRSNNTTRAKPDRFSLEPQADQTLKVGLFPTPDAVYGIDALIAALPSEWGTGAGTPPTIPFSRRAVAAHELLASAKLLAAMGGEQVVSLGIDKGALVRWERDAAELMRKEHLAVSRLRMSYGRTDHRWFAAWRRT